MQKVLNNQTPSYIKDLIVPYYTDRTLDVISGHKP